MNEAPADPREKWDRIYAAAADSGAPEPCEVLAGNAHLLPSSGRALDVACGLGGNALYLARRGFDTWAWDISAEAVARLSALARDLGIRLHGEVRDVVLAPPEPETFDAIVASRFLERGLAPHLIAALKPGGLLFYQTYTREKATDTGPRNPAFLLEPNELLALFAGLRLVVYREEGRLGDLASGFRGQAQLIGRKALV